MVGKASSLQVGKVGTEDALVGMTVAAVVECMGSLGHLVRRMHEGVRVGSMSRTVVVGKPPVLLRCRVPCLQDASPWRRKKSRVTAEGCVTSEVGVGVTEQVMTRRNWVVV
jgi:hypothetical protein